MTRGGPTRADVVVIGGGIAGLAVSFELLRPSGGGAPADVLCLEAAPRPGGNIRTSREDGFVCEWGPNGFLDNVPATLELVRRAGLEDRLLPSRAEAARRFLFRRGRLRELPTGLRSFLGTGILSPGAKLRLMREPLVRARRDGTDESVYDFCARRIGRESASVLVDAMVSGIYAGDVRRLSLPATFPKMRAMEVEHGGLFRAMLARRKRGGGGGPAGPGGRLTSFREGMQELVDRLAGLVGERLELDTPVTAIARAGDGYRVERAGGPPVDCAAVVLACPAAGAAPLVERLDAALVGPLSGIPSASLAVVHLGFRDDGSGRYPDGFGFLAPRGEGLRILGTLWSSSIFEGRAPSGFRVWTTMIGGAHDTEAVELDDATLVEQVRSDLARAVSFEARPEMVRVFRHPRGIPQYTMGHVERLAEIDRALARCPGVWVAGNSYRGIAVNACAEEAPRIAGAVREFLSTRAAACGGGSDRTVAVE